MPVRRRQKSDSSLSPSEDSFRPPDADLRMALWADDYWDFLTGRVTDKRGAQIPVILTKDERDSENPYKPLPDYPFLHWLADDLMSEQVVFVDKARQLMVTHLILLLAFWICSFKQGRRVILSKSTEDDAKELLADKIVGPWSRMPGWVQSEIPMRCHGDPSAPSRLTFPKTDSYILGLPQNIAKRARGGTPSLVIVDEAAFQDQLSEILSTLLPMETKMWLPSTPGDAGPGAATWIKYVDVSLGKEVETGERQQRVGALGTPVEPEYRGEDEESTGPDPEFSRHPRRRR